MSDEPDTTTYIARTGKGWAAGPNKMAAEIRAIVNSYPEPDVDHYKVEIFKVDATDWEVTGLGGISSTYVEEIRAYIMPGEKPYKYQTTTTTLKESWARANQSVKNNATPRADPLPGQSLGNPWAIPRPAIVHAQAFYTPFLTP